VIDVTEPAEPFNGNVRLRRYAPGDAPACCVVVRDTVSAMPAMSAAARTLIVSHARPEALGAELDTCFTMVAVVDGLVVGLAALDGDEIKRVYVHPSVQSKGIGRALVSALEVAAWRRGCTAVRIVAGADAATFYATLGYERMSEGVHVDGEARVPFVEMRKTITASKP